MLSVDMLLLLEKDALECPNPSQGDLVCISEKRNVTLNAVKNAYIRIGQGQDFLDEVFTGADDEFINSL